VSSQRSVALQQVLDDTDHGVDALERSRRGQLRHLSRSGLLRLGLVPLLLRPLVSGIGAALLSFLFLGVGLLGRFVRLLGVR
jgi:hypothetical protein